METRTGRKAPARSSLDFLNGLVFGFDVGTSSIGYAVRRGNKFLDVGVLICREDTNDLSSRRSLRRQRRTLRSRKRRRQWFATELEKLGLPRPEKQPHDPIALRVRAVNAEALKPEELHAALAHLFKRRGYSTVPWAATAISSRRGGDPESKEDDEGVIIEKIEEIRGKLAGLHPCQYLARRREEVGQSPIENWARKIYWPREALRNEFLAVVEAQKSRFPKLAEKTEWLLYGDTKEVRGQRVFFDASGSRNPGVLGLRWPRFDNRGPALDSLQPVDQHGRPLHVVRKNKEVFTKAQWELAVLNFRVVERNTGRLVAPDPKSMARLREIWESKKRRRKPNVRVAATAARPGRDLEISSSVLEKWAEEFSSQYQLVEDQKPLTPQSGAGRARYCSPTLERIVAGERFDPPQPVLRREGESADQALNRYLADVRHPLVRHRLVLYRRLLANLVSRFGRPSVIVLEAVRSLALGRKAKIELNKRNEQFRKERQRAREQLSTGGESVSRRAIQRYCLWQEAKGRCPFCLLAIERTDLGRGADIEHLVPRSMVDCSESYNLTVAHLKCNRELKGDRTPFAAFGSTPSWDGIKDNAEKCFQGRKRAIFLSPNAEELIEQKADLQHTAYIARVIRQVALIQLGWLGQGGRDPTPEKQNAALRFQVTNGQLTSRLRKAWGLNQILHRLPNGKRWDELTESEQKQLNEKNRGDLRHHALDAMVIACTLPWLAHRTYGATDEFGNHGWWSQDEKRRSKAANPVFPREGQMHEVVKQEMERVVVRPHVSRSSHRKKLDTTPLSLRVIEEDKVKKEVFVARRRLREKSPDAIAGIFSSHLREYIAAEWSAWSQANPDWDNENKGSSKGKFPARFISQLSDPIWKKPIQSVKFIVEKSRLSVFKVGEHPTGQRRGIYVAYGENKEVHIFARADAGGFVAQPVRPCYAPGQAPNIPEGAGKKVFTIRRGTLFRLNTRFRIGKRELQPEIYRVVALPGEADARVSFFPHYLNSSAKGSKRPAPIRADIEKLAGHITLVTSSARELPHPSPAQPQPPGAVQA